jgi:hypothetical protein
MIPGMPFSMMSLQHVFQHTSALALTVALTILPLQAAQPEDYRVDWHLRLQADVDLAEVTLRLEDAAPVDLVSFPLDSARFSNFSATGELQQDGNFMRWVPPRRDARLSYQVRITRERENQNQDESYDALMTADWALFRGDRLTPRVRVNARNGARSESVLHFELPEDWEVFTGWPAIRTDGSLHTFALDEPQRDFERPRGWMMAGKVVNRQTQVGSTDFNIVGPRNSGIDRMGWLTLVRLVWPELEAVFGKVPPKILMVSGNDPLWRGGLSGPNSFFFHSSRRAISQNGTSPLFHEMVHVVSNIHGADQDDWIAEGIAEYYGIELLYRAGGYDDATRDAIYADLAEWAEDAEQLRLDESAGPVTARAVLVFDQLDREIRTMSDGRATLDDVVRLLMTRRWVSLTDLQTLVQDVTGLQSKVLDRVE